MALQIIKNFKTVNSQFTQILLDHCMVIDHKGIIQWIGPFKEIPKKYLVKNFYKKNIDTKKLRTIDLKGKLVFPSFIECHTHSVFAGSRADEFEMRLRGKSYLEIAQAGGGILSTMTKTRQASEQQLLRLTEERVLRYLKQGVSTLEIKSGYALDLKNEIKMLNVINTLKKKYHHQDSIQIISTFLGAHAKPPEFSSYKDYLKFLGREVLPTIKRKKLTNRVDIFIEKGFFEAKESLQYLKKAKQLGFQTVIHANQLTLSGGIEVAIKQKSLSADHVIQMTDQLIDNLAQTKTVAVLLPTADLYMKCEYPQARKMIDAGVTVALATDFNPGSCPSQDLSLVGVLARLKMNMTLPEVFQAYTSGAAKALGVFENEGELVVGKKANFICTEANLSDFFYSVGFTPKHQLFIRGNRVY